MIDKAKLIKYLEDDEGIKLPATVNAGTYVIGFNDACDRILAEIRKGCMDVKHKHDFLLWLLNKKEKKNANTKTL